MGRKWPNAVTEKCREKLLVMVGGTEWHKGRKRWLCQVQGGTERIFMPNLTRQEGTEERTLEDVM